MTGPRWAPRWQARWIWAGPAWDAESGNRLVFFRRSFAIDDVPGAAPARVTADTRYILWVNGVEVSRGPARNIPERLAYHELDFAPYLRPGRNVVAALVRHYGSGTRWSRLAKCCGEIGRGSFALEAPRIGLMTDSTWRSRPAPWAPHPPGDDPVREVVDGSEWPRGWLDVDFDDEEWPPAMELSGPGIGGVSSLPPTPPYSGMEPAAVAEQTVISREGTLAGTGRVPALVDDDLTTSYDPDVTLAEGDAFVTFDTGQITHGTIHIELTAERGVAVDVYVGEDVSEAGLAIIEPRRWAARYLAAGVRQEQFETFDPIGLRYVTTVVRGSGQVTGVRAVERRYPRSGHADFACSDDRFDRLWHVGARTVELCSLDAFVDCPGREQQAWIGDSYIHTLVTMVTNDDWRLVRRHLRIATHSRRPDGFLSAIAASGEGGGALNIPEYSAHWIRALCRYVERSGDLALAVELLPTAADVVSAFERDRGTDGLLRLAGIVFVDWAQTERGDVTGAVDALYAAALLDYAKLVEWATGDTQRAAWVRARHAETAAAFAQLWDEARGVYVDALFDPGRPGRRVSQQTNALAIVGGCAPEMRWQGMLDVIMDPGRVRRTLSNGDLPPAQHWLYQMWEPQDFDAERHVVMAQPFARHFLHQAVAMAGRGHLMAGLCLDWMPQLDRGNTTFEEFWEAPTGAVSRCHGWSATPTYDLTTHVLGVQPIVESAVDLGLRRILVEPVFRGLDAIAGTVPTPHGALRMQLRPTGGWLHVPDGVHEVTVRLPTRQWRVGAGAHALS